MVRSILVLLCFFNCSSIIFGGTITSASSGSWSSASTWQGGLLPSSADSVIISSGHIITITNTNAVCGSISFASTSAQLAFTTASSALSVYGNFTIATSSHQAFAQWTDGARVIFAGSASVQTLSGWSSSETGTSFPQLIINKPSGKVITSGSNMRLTIGSLLEVQSGTFELALGDDIETRDFQNVPSRANFIVRSSGNFIVAGGNSYIRRGSFTNIDSARIGSITVQGKISLACNSSSRINTSSVEINNGGEVTFLSSWVTGAFNAGQFIVQSGGRVINKTTTNFWYNPTQVVIAEGADYYSESSSTQIPFGAVFSGNMHYISSTGSTQFFSLSLDEYSKVFLGGIGEKKLSLPTHISRELHIADAATLNTNTNTLTYSDSALLSFESQTVQQTIEPHEWPEQSAPDTIVINNPFGVTMQFQRTISSALVLKKGLFNNTPNAVSLAAGGGVIRYQGGSIATTPAYLGQNYVMYKNYDSAISTGNELSLSQPIQTISCAGNAPVHLSISCSIGGSLTLTGSSLYTDANQCIFLATATAPVETDSHYISGNVLIKLRPALSLQSSFAGTAFPAGSDTTSYQIVRNSGSSITANGNESIDVKWHITTATGSIQQPQTVQLQWLSRWDNDKVFSNANPPELWYSADAGLTWNMVSGAQIINMHAVAFQLTECGLYTISDRNHPLAGEAYILSATAFPEGLWNGSSVIRDTITAELHGIASPYELIGSSKQLMATNGTGIYRFYNIQNGVGYYLVMRHRNSIDIWSSAPITGHEK